MNYELTQHCSFEEDINDTSMEHDAVSTKPYPKKLIAYIRGDYSYKWWTGYFSVHEALRTPDSDREGDALLNYLIAEKFPNLNTLQKYCKRFGSDSEDCWFYVEGEKCNYALRLIPMENNYNLYLYQYAKEI